MLQVPVYVVIDQERSDSVTHIRQEVQKAVAQNGLPFNFEVKSDYIDPNHISFC